MPRTNRPRRPRRGARPEEPERDDVARLRGALRRTETRRGRAWTVQPIAPERAVKPYVCPGCPNPIPVGVAHLAVWPADHLFGDDRALEERRHWHEHCWRMS